MFLIILNKKFIIIIQILKILFYIIFIIIIIGGIPDQEGKHWVMAKKNKQDVEGTFSFIYINWVFKVINYMISKHNNMI